MSAFCERGLCLKTNVPGLMIRNSFSLLESENKTSYMTPTDSDDNIYKGVSQYQSLLLTTVLLKNTPTYRMQDQISLTPAFKPFIASANLVMLY